MEIQASEAVSGIMQYMVLLIPLMLIELALMITALVHVLRHDKYRHGSKGMWVAIVLIFQIIGPILYFAIGRGEKE